MESRIQSLSSPQDSLVRLELAFQRLKAEKVKHELTTIAASEPAPKVGEFRLPPPAMELKQDTLYSYVSAEEISKQLTGALDNYNQLRVDLAPLLDTPSGSLGSL